MDEWMDERMDENEHQFSTDHHAERMLEAECHTKSHRQTAGRMDDDVASDVVNALFDQLLLAGDFTADLAAPLRQERRNEILYAGFSVRVVVGVVQ